MACWKSDHKTQLLKNLYHTAVGTTGITKQHLTACLYVVLVWSKEAVLHWQKVFNPSIIHSQFHISPICLACALPPPTERNRNGFSVWQDCTKEIHLNSRSRERGICGGVPKHSSSCISTQQITWPLRVGSLCLWVASSTSRPEYLPVPYCKDKTQWIGVPCLRAASFAQVCVIVQ